MSRPSARTVALRDQILAALSAEWPLPVSTRRVCEMLGAHRYDETGYRVYPQLCALDRLGLVERIRRGPDCRDVFWRFLGDPTEADFNAAVDVIEAPDSRTLELKQGRGSAEPTDDFEAILATLDRYIKALDVAERQFVTAAATGDYEVETDAADELAAVVRQFVNVCTNWPANGGAVTQSTETDRDRETVVAQAIAAERFKGRQLLGEPTATDVDQVRHLARAAISALAQRVR